MKPTQSKAMADLIGQIKEAIPFDVPEADMCSGDCIGCPKKLLEFLDTEIEFCEFKLADGEQPSLGEIDRLAKCSKKIYKALEKNKLV